MYIQLINNKEQGRGSSRDEDGDIEVEQGAGGDTEEAAAGGRGEERNGVAAGHPQNFHRRPGERFQFNSV